jgi:hypothetical protein
VDGVPHLAGGRDLVFIDLDRSVHVRDVPEVEERREHLVVVVRVVLHERHPEKLIELVRAGARREQVGLLFDRQLAERLVAEVQGARELRDAEGLRLRVAEAPERDRDAAAPLVIGELSENAADVVHGRRLYNPRACSASNQSSSPC